MKLKLLFLFFVISSNVLIAQQTKSTQFLNNKNPLSVHFTSIITKRFKKEIEITPATKNKLDTCLTINNLTCNEFIIRGVNSFNSVVEIATDVCSINKYKAFNNG